MGFGPTISEWFQQWSREPGESLSSDVYSKAITLGAVGMFVVLFGLALLVSPFVEGLVEGFLTFRVVLPAIGSPAVVPSLVLLGGLGAVMFALASPEDLSERELLEEEIIWILGSVATTFLVMFYLGTQYGIDWSGTVVFAFFELGLLFVGVASWRWLTTNDMNRID